MGESSSSVSLYSRSDRSSMRPPRSEMDPMSSGVSISIRAASSRATSVISVSVSAVVAASVPAAGGVRAMSSPLPVSAGWLAVGGRALGSSGTSGGGNNTNQMRMTTMLSAVARIRLRFWSSMMAPCPRVRSQEGSTEGGDKGQGAFWRRPDSTGCVAESRSTPRVTLAPASPLRARLFRRPEVPPGFGGDGCFDALCFEPRESIGKRHGPGEAEPLDIGASQIDQGCLFFGRFHALGERVETHLPAQRDDPADHRLLLRVAIDSDHEGPVDLDAAHAEASDRQKRGLPHAEIV